MTSLVLELQRAALNPNSSVSDLLRMAFVVARKLGIHDLEEWVSAELNGYPDGVEIPSYRVLRGDLQAKNPYRGWIPLRFQDEKMAEGLSQCNNGQSVGEIENSLAEARSVKGGGTFHVFFPPSLEQTLMALMEGPAMQPAVQITASALHGIIEVVRNSILDWSLKLEAAGVLGKDLTFSTEEKAHAASALAGQTFYQVQNQTVIHQMTQSQIQQGTTDSVQVVLQRPDAHVVQRLVSDIREHLGSFSLPTEVNAEIEADLKTVEAQNASPKPRLPIMRESLRSIRSILENAVGGAAGAGISAVASGLLERLASLIS
jgi:hypothetical protein